MKRTALILALLLTPALAKAQGQQITAGPYPNSGLLYVCPVPSGGTPCPSPSSIFKDSGLTQSLGNPIVVFAQQTYTFYAASGQYTLEMPASGIQQVVGGSGGGISAVDPAFVGVALPSVGGAPQIIPNNICYAQNAGSVSSLACTLPLATSQNHTYLVNVFQTNTATVSSVATTQVDTCVQVGSTQNIGGKNNQTYKCVNVLGGASTVITANFSSAISFPTMVAIELTPSDVDVQASATGTSTAPSSGNFTTTNTQDTLIGFVDFLSTSSCNAAITVFNQCNLPGSGYATVQGQDGQFARVNIWIESQQVTGTGTFAANGTLNVSSTWAAFGVAMKGTAVTPVLSNSTGTGPFSLGTITSLLTPVQFKISGGQITAGQGQLSINVTSGSITNPAWVLEASVDGGTSWHSVPCSPRTQTNVVSSEQVPIYSAQCSLTGLMGETGTNFRFGPYQGYGISNLVVWGAI